MARPKNDGRGRMGGRQKGTPNRATSDLKAWINLLIDDNCEQVQQDLERLDPKDRLAFIEKLLRYVVPQESKITQEATPSELLAKIEASEPDLADWIKGRYLNDPKVITMGTPNALAYLINRKFHPEGGILISGFTRNMYSAEEFEKLPESQRRETLINEWLDLEQTAAI